MSGRRHDQAGLIPKELIERRVVLLRGQKAMLDRDLADLYGVETRALTQAVRRNPERFLPGFMFQMTEEELEQWRSQIVMSNPSARMSLRRRPYAFTEQGVAMLSSVLRSERAVQVNIAIMRVFVRMREVLTANKELAHQVAEHDRKITQLFKLLRNLLAAKDEPPSRPIGFRRP